MYTVLAGSLAAQFNLDGGHLSRYLIRREAVTRTLCEELVLHDRIVIPTHDYLTACGLIRILGEQHFTELLESDRIRFARMRGLFGYVRGTGPDGTVIAFLDPDAKKPQSSPVEDSISAGLDVIADTLKNRKKLSRLLVQQSTSLEMSEVVDAVKADAFRDLRGTPLWRDEFDFPDKSLLALPGMEQMQVRVLGPGESPKENPVDALLHLTLLNIELLLTQRFACSSSSTGSSIGDLVELKVARLSEESSRHKNLWTLFEVNGVPDTGKVDLSDRSTFKQLLHLSQSRNAVTFRGWFHQLSNQDERTIFKEYLDLWKEVPWGQRLPTRVLRYFITTGAGFVPVLGHVVSFLDSFVVDRFLNGSSPKFFVEDVKTFVTGQRTG